MQMYNVRYNSTTIEDLMNQYIIIYKYIIVLDHHYTFYVEEIEINTATESFN